jgi:DNA-binding NarL/FixJ family response regulator
MYELKIWEFFSRRTVNDTEVLDIEGHWFLAMPYRGRFRSLAGKVEPMDKTARKLLVVEDHELVAVGLQSALQASSPAEMKYELLFSNSLAAALAVIDPSLTLILLDLCLPDVDEQDPLSGLRTLYQLVPDTPIVIFSAIESPALIGAALKAGAAGFIPKRTKTGIVIAAIEIVLNGGIYLPPHLMSLLANLTEPEPADGGSTPMLTGLSLTPRQQSVLELLLDGQSNKEIARALSLSVGTVKNYVSELLRSTNTKTRSRILAMLSLKSEKLRDPP